MIKRIQPTEYFGETHPKNSSTGNQERRESYNYLQPQTNFERGIFIGASLLAVGALLGVALIWIGGK